MKIAILGNSHTGCLATALQADPGIMGDIECAFFASGGGRLGGLEIKDRKLVPNNAKLLRNIQNSSKGLGHLDPADFDLFLLFGLRLYVPFIPEMTYSKAALDLTYRSAVREPVIWEVASSLRSLTSAPIYCGHSPLFARTKSEYKSKFGAPIIRYSESLRRFGSEFKELDIGVIEQPASTIVPEYCATKGEYQMHTGGYTILEDGTQHRDWSHMNSEFGKIYLKSFYDTVIKSITK